jgi:hypothetical protein
MLIYWYHTDKHCIIHILMKKSSKNYLRNKIQIQTLWYTRNQYLEPNSVASLRKSNVLRQPAETFGLIWSSINIFAHGLNCLNCCWVDTESNIKLWKLFFRVNFSMSIYWNSLFSNTDNSNIGSAFIAIGWNWVLYCSLHTIICAVSF